MEPHHVKSIIISVALVLAFGAVLSYSPQDKTLLQEKIQPPSLPLLDTPYVVVLDQKVFDELRTEYRLSKTERLFCLIGEKTDDEIIISDVFEESTRISEGTSTSSMAEFACQRSRVIGTMHFHLADYGNVDFLCEPSLADVYTFGTLAIRGPGHIIQAVQCAEDRFAFFDTSIGGNKSFEVKAYRWAVREDN